MSTLQNLKVLDLSRILAGPWASQMLADMGAEVIKVERPDGGDDTRRWGPPFMRNEGAQQSQQSAYFLSTNRGKKSVCIDLTEAAGQAAVRQLAADCDVVIENFKVGGAAKLGLDYASLSKLNPRLVYCSITGFGQTGPYANRPGYDFLVQAMGGLMSVTGEADEHGGAPQKIGVALSDIMTGLYATSGILAAIVEREQSGLGQHIDLALLDVTAATLANQASNYLVGGVVPTRLGNAHPNIVPYQSFATADGHCIIAVGNDAQFESFCKLLGQPGLATDARFVSNSKRVENRAELSAILQAEMLKQSASHWLTACAAANVPAGPINDIEQVFNDPQIVSRGMRVKLPHADNADLEVVANPLNFSRTPIQYSCAPPKLGEHTEQVLENLKWQN